MVRKRPIIDNLPERCVVVSDDLYESIEAMKWEFVDGKKYPKGFESTQWNHLQDALSRGTITPSEAYDALILGYLPENLKVRQSMYDHLV